MAPIPRLKPYSGIALFSYGFRPFFLAGALWAGAAILLWLPLFKGEIALATSLAPRDWHIHEMLFGFVGAVVTGFLLTAVPNWTGRLPLQGAPVAGLLAVWLAGRVAVALSAEIGWAAAAAIDLAFLGLVAAAVAREIVAGRNWRNGKVLLILLLLIAANAAFHFEAHRNGAADVSIRLAVAAVVGLLMLIGGRIVPSFTRNWLARENPGRLPAPFGPPDIATLVIAAAALVGWIAAPDQPLVGAAMIAAGLGQALRLARWAGWRALRDPLVLILHLAYGFIPLGFVLAGAAALVPEIPASAGMHAFTGGAIGAMTLAVMSRATLGHTGRALVASRATQLLYALVLAAAATRVAADLLPGLRDLLLHVAGAGWALAFLGFAAVYGPMLMRPRLGN